jgi:hypothetical protein
MPEHFLHEIGKLSEDERKRYRTRKLELFSSDGVISTGDQYKLALINQTYEKDKIAEMKFFLYSKQVDFAENYAIFLQQAKDWGWADLGEYLYSLTIKDSDKLTCVERTMLGELNEFEHIKSEIMALEEAINNREPEIIIPFPILDEKYKEELISELKHFMKFKSFDINDTILIPYHIPEETFMDRLYRIPGIEDEIKKCKNLFIINYFKAEENYRKKINSGLPIEKKDLNMKDEEIIRQIQIISQAIKVEPFVKEQKLKYEIPLDYIEEGMLGQIPTDGRILIEEYYKVLYLNNEDPEKYNFTYWENYFKVSKVTLRNIFNHVFFPIPNENNPSEVGKILYFKDVEYSKRRKMIAEMTSEEYQEYLSGTDERPELAEENRLQYLSYQTTSTEPRITERTVPVDDEDIDRQLESPLIYSPIIKEVDERIEQLLKGEFDTSSRPLLDKDVEIKLQDIKMKRIEFEKQREKEIIESTTPSMTKEEVQKYLADRVKKVEEKQKPDDSLENKAKVKQEKSTSNVDDSKNKEKDISSSEKNQEGSK